MKPTIHLKKICTLAIGVLLVICAVPLKAQPGEPNVKSDDSVSTNLTTAKATMEAYETGDWETLRSYLQENARIYGLGNFDSLTVDETINYWSAGREDAAPILADNGTWLNAKQPEGPQKGDWVYHWGTNTISYENGESVTFPYHIALKMQNNKIVEAHFYYDNMKIIRAMGYALSPPLDSDQEEVDEEVVGFLEEL